jgi:hypothetical protein
MRRPLLTGFVVGIVFACCLFAVHPKPAIIMFLEKPLSWTASLIDSLRLFPKESLEGLIIAMPLWFLYWGCLGALIGLLWHVIRKRAGHHGDKT